MIRERNFQTLKSIEDAVFDARHAAWKNGQDELYGKLDNALTLVQYLSMGLQMQSDAEDRKQP